ncbi:MAG TPA: efflux RND transporter periplasmic adaptor subunit [Candidatus Binataceae bacterium]|nr:efflux RND transporter periplasmic adaptor subunit [Candidatus Binataceae bacterium]
MIRKIIRRIVTLAIIAALGWGGYVFGGKYLWPPIDHRKIDVVGIIEAPEVNLTSRIAGRITALGLIEGDQVKRGQVVCQIEDIDLRNQLSQARANLEKALADVAEARRDFARDQKLFAEHIIPAKERDDAETTVAQDIAAVASARANVSLYQDQLKDTKVVSPVDGVVVNKALEVGEWVTPGTPILTIDDLSTIWARVDVEESDLGSIYVGKPARVVLPTNPPLVFSGRVIAIGDEGQFATERDVRRGRQDIRTFYVKVRVLQGGGDVKPGMTAEVTFLRDTRSSNGTSFSSDSDRKSDQALR